MPGTQLYDGSLSPEAAEILEAASRNRETSRHGALGVHHWLQALLQRDGSLAESMAQGLHVRFVREYLDEQLRHGNCGDPLESGTVVRRRWGELWDGGEFKAPSWS